MNFELDYKKYEAVARQVAAEGIVLLRNENNALPLAEASKIKVALFGRMQNHYYRSGSGSGGMVNAPVSYSIAEVLKDELSLCIDSELVKVYEDWELQNPYKQNRGYGMEYWSQEEMPVSLNLANEYSEKNDAAIIIIGRTAGEDRDNSSEAGSYKLTDTECEMLENVCKAFERVIVVLNVGNIIDMGFVEMYKPSAVLLAWQGGMMGAHGLADVITGRVNPSGHLADTIAKACEDYPATDFFGSETRNYYGEDIYVGYRYFETFQPSRVLYPFGFGLSYTDFEIVFEKAEYDGTDIKIEVCVNNTGSRAGKQVVQVYVSAPQGELGKPEKVLIAFAKTKELAANESQQLSFTIDKKAYASFDDFGKTGSGFVLEKGKYTVYVGANVREAVNVLAFELSENEIVEELDSAMKPYLPYKRMKPDAIVHNNGTDVTYSIGWEEVPLKDIANEVTLGDSTEISAYNSEAHYTYQDVASGKISIQEFMACLTEEDLCSIVRGEGMRSEKVTPGTASAFGGVNEHLKSLGIPCGCMDDGPSGMRLDSGMRAFSLPNGTMMACTFNTELIEQLYVFTGIEMRKNKVDVLLGPGMNIHRHPFNGRNFEYFSEDPLLTGSMAVAQIKALHSVGVDGAIKHFCGNNQETKRFELDSVVSERALREIYLRGFEIAVKQGNAHFVMTTYGRVNGLWTANDYELTKVILRDQWGFDGLVMTDWWAALNVNGREDEPGCKGSHTDFTRMVKAQNDIYMVCPDSATNGHGDNLSENLANGTLTRNELGICAMHILTALMRLPASERANGTLAEVDEINIQSYWMDSMEATDAVYEIKGDEATFDISHIGTARGDSYTFALNVEKPGGYVLEIEAEATCAFNIPIPVSIIIGGKPGDMLTYYGSNGDVLTKESRFLVEEKNNLWRIFFSHDGIVARKMTVRYECDMQQAVSSGNYKNIR